MEHVETIIQGKKIEESAARKLDPARMRIALTGTPRPAEVEGQAQSAGFASCPWCKGVGRVSPQPLSSPLASTSPQSDSTNPWFRCGACGGAYGT